MAPPLKRRKKNEGDGAAASEKEAPLVVFAHGAGAPSTSEWMVRWKKMLEEVLGAVEVITFDYPYISGGKRKAPPKAEKLVEYHHGIVKDAISKYPGHPLILAGKSMGSRSYCQSLKKNLYVLMWTFHIYVSIFSCNLLRISCMVSVEEDVSVAAIICLGYPLKGMNGAVRDETLLKLDAPTMFVQGSKDNLCPLQMLEKTMKKMKCENEWYVIDGGDHSFKIGKKLLQSSGISQADAEEKGAKAIADFVAKHVKVI